jgi:hypothetical protein
MSSTDPQILQFSRHREKTSTPIALTQWSVHHTLRWWYCGARCRVVSRQRVVSFRFEAAEL